HRLRCELVAVRAFALNRDERVARADISRVMPDRLDRGQVGAVDLCREPLAPITSCCHEAIVVSAGGEGSGGGCGSAGAVLKTVQRQSETRDLPGVEDGRRSTLIQLTDEMKTAINNALVDGVPIIISSVDATGQPSISLRGSTQAFSDSQLAIWVRDPNGNF